MGISLNYWEVLLGVFFLMALRASSKLLRHVLNKKPISSSLVSARHCASAAEAAPKIPHSSKKVCSLSVSHAYVCIYVCLYVCNCLGICI